MTESAWIREILDAALEDDAVRKQDFRCITASGRAHRSSEKSPSWLLKVAAAFFIAVLLPIGYYAGKQSIDSRRINMEINALFVDRLIGESLFDKGLAIDSTWITDYEDTDALPAFELDEMSILPML
ncbi:MAG: hypothetical protein B6D68_03135 [spirochete symbiont of Stewartia floridana]|nr:MAG: hypothetical protein B6D68_03135 [spirochete symbiont of Stewartia floridana]